MKIKDIIEKADAFEREMSDQIEKRIVKERKLELLKQYQGEDKIISWSELVDKVKSQGEPERFVSGIETFDKELRGGIERGRLVVLSASSKMGKTSFCIDLMRKYREYNPCMITLEQPAEELIREQLFYGNEIPQAYSPKKFNQVNTNWIEDRLLESFLKNGSKVAIIDHLDFIETDIKAERRFQIQNIMQDLILMARRLNITIILISHINKLAPEEAPNYYNLAESSSIYKLADIILFLWRECIKVNGKIEYTGLVNLRIDLSRQGGTGTDIGMIFNKGVYREADSGERLEISDRKDSLLSQNKKKDF